MNRAAVVFAVVVSYLGPIAAVAFVLAVVPLPSRPIAIDALAGAPAVSHDASVNAGASSAPVAVGTSLRCAEASPVVAEPKQTPTHDPQACTRPTSPIAGHVGCECALTCDADGNRIENPKCKAYCDLTKCKCHPERCCPR